MITIGIVDDHRIFRLGLRQLIDTQEDMTIILEAQNGPEFLKKLNKKAPDVTLLDIDLPGTSGLEILKSIKTTIPNMKTVILTVYNDSAHLREAMALGADGYLIKQNSEKEVLAAIRAANRGRVKISDNIINQGTSFHELTEKELDIIRLTVKGFSTAQIAKQIGISARTVQGRRLKIYRKLGINSKEELLREAYNNRMI